MQLAPIENVHLSFSTGPSSASQQRNVTLQLLNYASFPHNDMISLDLNCFKPLYICLYFFLTNDPYGEKWGLSCNKTTNYVCLHGTRTFY